MFKTMLDNIGLLVKHPIAWVCLILLSGITVVWKTNEAANVKVEFYLNKVAECERSRVQDYKSFKEEQVKEYKEMVAKAEVVKKDYYKTKSKIKK